MRLYKAGFLTAAALGLGAVGMVGCELIATVDRSTIDGSGGSDATGGGMGGMGTGGAGGMGGVGGVGGMPPECMMPVDCPDPMNECIQRTCTNGMCGTTNFGNETTLANQTTGDCKTAVCDGSGGTTTIPEDADIDNDANQCTKDACSAGMIVHTN